MAHRYEISLIGTAIVLALGIMVWPMLQKEAPPAVIGCTMEAKICPDGSAVGRSGPQCEFAPCPEMPDTTLDYPAALETTYITPEKWPPAVRMTSDPYTCEVRPLAPSQSERTRHVISGTEYCIERSVEGAAGSTYTTYVFTVPNGNVSAVIDLVLRMPQCANYDDPQKSACEKEQSEFSIDTLVAQTVAAYLK